MTQKARNKKSGKATWLIYSTSGLSTALLFAAEPWTKKPPGYGD